MAMTKEQRDEVKARLEEIARRHGGRLTPEDVVNDARRKDSPLHDYFTWDMKEAAKQYWIDQARSLIRSVEVVITHETQSLRVPYFVRDPSATEKEQGYTSIAQLMTDEDSARSAICAEFARVGSALARARRLAVALGAEADIDRLLDEVAGVRSRFDVDSAAQAQ